MKTLIRHVVCGEPIYVVDRLIGPGCVVVASEWHPLDALWPEPVAGEVMRCPSCGAALMPGLSDLQATVVEDW